MPRRRDPMIDRLIRPPRPRFVGFDWSRSGRLKPTGAAHDAKVVSERLRRGRDDHDEPTSR